MTGPGDTLGSPCHSVPYAHCHDRSGAVGGGAHRAEVFRNRDAGVAAGAISGRGDDLGHLKG
jgi:hypothetical protein